MTGSGLGGLPDDGVECTLRLGSMLVKNWTWQKNIWLADNANGELGWRNS